MQIESMNTEHRYILSSNKAPKLDCPYCGAKKHWQRYIDIETGEILPEQHGRCDNENKCGKWITPKDTGYAKEVWKRENGITESTQITVPKSKYLGRRSKAQRQSEPVYFDFETFKRTLGNYEQNIFLQNLMKNVLFPFEAVEVTKIIQLYRLGTVANGYRMGAVTFPFIDAKNNVRTIQVKQFDKTNHTTGTDFLHSIIEKHHDRNNKPLPEWLQAYLKQDKRVSCLFGAHLLSKYPQNPVALVEAPKTAVYGTLYFGLPDRPDNLVWLAVYNKSSFSLDKLKALKGRDVFVFPDLSKDGSTFREWETKALAVEKQLPGTKFIFSDLLERYATPQQKKKGADIADVLIQMDWRKFRKQKPFETSTIEPEKVNISKAENLTKPYIQKSTIEPKRLKKVEIENDNVFFEKLAKVSIENLTKPHFENWDNEVLELENYFTTIDLKQTVKLNGCNVITNVPKFIKTHLATVKHYNGKRVGKPYLNRLFELKQKLTENKNLTSV